MKLAARTRYAARLLLCLAQHGNQSPLKTMALSEATGISVQFIEQILKPLKKAGIVTSVRGAAGGHLLDHNPDAVTFGDIIRAMEDGIDLTHCCRDEVAKECGRAEKCLTRNVWLRASKALERELDAITLSDVLCGEMPFAILEGDTE